MIIFMKVHSNTKDIVRNTVKKHIEHLDIKIFLNDTTVLKSP